MSYSSSSDPFCVTPCASRAQEDGKYQDRVDITPHVVHEDQPFQFVSYEAELDRIRQEMETKVRVEMEAKIRQEMEAKRLEEKMRRFQQEKEEKESKQHEIDAIKQHNTKMVDVFMGYFTRVFRDVGSQYVTLGDVNRLKPLLEPILASLDSRALHLTAYMECHLKMGWDMSLHIYLITATSVSHTYLLHWNDTKTFLWRNRLIKCGELLPLYMFHTPLVVGSMEEIMLSKVCSRYSAHCYQAPSCANIGIDKRVGQGSIHILQDIVHCIPGTPSKDASFL